MTPVLRAIEAHPALALELYAGGEHLLPELGDTLRDVRARFSSVRVIDAVQRGDTPEAQALFAGKVLERVAADLGARRPDVMLVLGDRAEMLAVASACLYLQVPVAHIHGGELTTTVDDVARHAISKLAHLHFPATADAARRLERLGEERWRIHVAGAPALDTIRAGRLPDVAETRRRIGLAPAARFLLVTLHPTSEEWREARAQMHEVLSAALSFDLPVVVIHPHADAGGAAMIEEIAAQRSNPRLLSIPSVEHELFLALERDAAAWIGNSSAALIESASFRTPVVNIGERQRGRLRGANVIDAPCSAGAIRAALGRALSDPSFRATLASCVNPWGDGETGPRIARLLAEAVLDRRLLAKGWVD